MTRHVLTHAGVVVADFSTPGATLLTRDGASVYSYTEAATPPPSGGSFPYTPLKPDPKPGGGAVSYQYDKGVSYACQLPVTNSGSGSVELTGQNGTLGAGADVEMCISKIPADWDWAKAQSRAVSGPFGQQTVFPYYIRGSSNGVSIGWAPLAPNQGVAGIPPGETWYCSIRVTNASGSANTQIPLN